MPRYKESERQQARQETRRSLLDSAVEEFARQGYLGARVDRISRQAGFAKGTIYNYFESKRAIMTALIEDFSSAHYEYLAECVGREADPRHRLTRFFTAGYEFVTQNLAQGRVMVNVIFGPDAEFREQMYTAYQPMFELVAREIIAPGIAQNIYRPQDPGSTAGLIMTIYLGVASQVNDEGEFWLPSAQVAEFVLNALGANTQEGIP